MKDTTKIIHKGRKAVEHFGTVNPPICQTSTMIFPTLADYDKAEEGEIFYKPLFTSNTTDPAYGIAGNQTHFALQEILRELENAASCYLTSSGLSAITVTLVGLLEAGDHLLMVDCVYGPTRRFCNKILAKNGVETTYYNPEIGADIAKLIKPNTKVIFMESPGSLTFEAQDISAIVKVAKERNIKTVIDNSWATPLYLKPLDLGVDVSIHAVTKFINGGSDLLMGAILSNKETSPRIANIVKNLGISVSAYDCSLVLRGIRSLKARLDYQQKTLKKVLAYLKTEPKVKEILCPAFEGFSGYNMWKKYFKGATPLFSIRLDNKYTNEQLAKAIDNYEYISVGASWGGFESLVRVLKLDGVRTAVSNRYNNTLIRYYLGLEDADDIINDLKEGFKRLS
ncbi:MAG TPA: cystathionine beta-lyase [Alphaproteobacteria bacterium]|nr:cystathionine beta-lyase [Alphaproteobacteria bacterium]